MLFKPSSKHCLILEILSSGADSPLYKVRPDFCLLFNGILLFQIGILPLRFFFYCIFTSDFASFCFVCIPVKYCLIKCKTAMLGKDYVLVLSTIIELSGDILFEYCSRILKEYTCSSCHIMGRLPQNQKFPLFVVWIFTYCLWFSHFMLTCSL